jgi:hypothetical protein
MGRDFGGEGEEGDGLFRSSAGVIDIVRMNEFVHL